MKQRARIIAGSNTRRERQGARTPSHLRRTHSCGACLYHLLKGWKSSNSPVNPSDIRLFIPA